MLIFLMHNRKTDTYKYSAKINDKYLIVEQCGVFELDFQILFIVLLQTFPFFPPSSKTKNLLFGSIIKFVPNVKKGGISTSPFQLPKENLLKYVVQNYGKPYCNKCTKLPMIISLEMLLKHASI